MARKKTNGLTYLFVYAAVFGYAFWSDDRTEPSPRRPAIERGALTRPAPLSRAPVQVSDTETAPSGRPQRGLAERIVEDTDKAQNAVGSAVAVDGRGLFLSARHVTHDCDEVYIEATRSERGERRWLKAERLVEHPYADLVLIDTGDRGVGKTALGSAAVLGQAPRPDARGVMVGYPQGKPATVTARALGEVNLRFAKRGPNGRVIKRRRGDRAERGTAWAESGRYPSFSGSLGGISGGPAFAGNGEVVGIVVAGSARRGRVFTSQPVNIATLADFAPTGTVSPLGQDVAREGERLRAERSVAFVYCKVF